MPGNNVLYIGDRVKKCLLFIIISAFMANNALSMELPTYIPQSASTYALTAAFITSTYYTAYWYAHPSPFTSTPDSINLFTCTPIQNNKDQGHPWHTLVERIQQGNMPHKTIMQVESNPAIAIDVQKGVTTNPKHNTLFLFSRGFATRGSLISGTPLIDEYEDIVNIGGGLMAGHLAIKDNLVINAPCYSFDYPDTPRYLNLGQDKDVACLRTAYDEITRKNPDAGIVGIGDCRGSKALLEFATEQPDKLKALVLMAPFVSLQELARHIADNYLKFPYSDKILHNFMRYTLPSVNLDQDNLAERLHLINHMPIFIAHRIGDSVISHRDIQLLVNRLQNSGNADVYLLEVTDTDSPHSRLSHIPEVQQALNAFYASYDLPHDPQLAQEGKELLKKAHNAAQSMISKNK